VSTICKDLIISQIPNACLVAGPPSPGPAVAGGGATASLRSLSRVDVTGLAPVAVGGGGRAVGTLPGHRLAVPDRRCRDPRARISVGPA
jgi:hypothetical protein